MMIHGLWFSGQMISLLVSLFFLSVFLRVLHRGFLFLD